MHQYFIVHKPFNVLSQFSKIGDKETLADYFKVQKDVYPIGRLDHDSEGLLLLSNDKKLNHQLLDPHFKHEREYWVQVEGAIREEDLDKLMNGISISIDGKQHRTLAAKAAIFVSAPKVEDRVPPIRVRKTVPDSWIKLILNEGKNRQVRRMTAAIGYPTLRLIRYRIEQVTLEGILPGEMKAFSKSEMYNLLNIKS